MQKSHFKNWILGRIQLIDTADSTTTRYYYEGDRVVLECEEDSGSYPDARCFVYGNFNGGGKRFGMS